MNVPPTSHENNNRLQNDTCPKVCDEKIIVSHQAVAKQGLKNTELQGISESDDKKTSEIRKHLPGFRPGPDDKVNDLFIAELTRTRPAVQKYGLNRYSPDEWKGYNQNVSDRTTINSSLKVTFDSKKGIIHHLGNISKARNENDQKLRERAKELFKWKIEVENAARAITAEVEKLEFERQRLKAASKSLMLPESISKECLDLRTNRAIPDLVADLAEIGLVKEMNLVKEVRDTITKTLKQVEDQLARNKAAKHRIEYDWSDKMMAYNCDRINLGLSPENQIFRPGATKFGENSASLEYWENLSSETILNIEAVRQESADLRGSLNAVLVQGAAKLRNQADKTDLALAETVATTQTLLTNLEKTLRNVLLKTADLEKIIENFHESIKKMDAAMKVAQTRLDNRNNLRYHGENVRDVPHQGLLVEVKTIHETVSSLRGQLNNAVNLRKDLIKKRIELEKDIASKKKTLNIDRDRCGTVRAKFPTAAEIAGYLK